MLRLKVKISEGFTLVELLIVIAILAILAAAVVLVINPAELLAQSRDSERMSDFQTIKKAVSIYTIDFPSASLGNAQTVYISLPDSNSSCSSYTLPPLPGSWQYHCATAADFMKVNNSGWIPIDFSAMPSGTPLPRLPIDPVNNNLSFYSYIPSGTSYEIGSSFESVRFNLSGGDDRVSTDGGDEPTKYESGSDVTVSPWTFDFKNFLTTTTKNGLLGWYKNSGSGSVTTGSDAYADNFIRATGAVWYEWQENIPFNPNSTYKIGCRLRQTADPVTGTKNAYCGWAGVTGDKVTYANKTGANSSSSQHYHGMSGSTLVVDPNFTDRFGYTRGFGSPNGNDSGCSNPATPCVMYQSVRYLRPLFILNLTGDGIADMDSFTISKY